MSAGIGKWAVPVLAALALADATYLAVVHWLGEIPACAGYSGCEQVNFSPYAEIFGVPIAYLGTALFLVVLGIALWRVRATGHAWARATLLLYSLVLGAAVFMAYLTAIEALVLRAYCYWCLGLAFISLLLLVLITRDLWIYEPTAALSEARR